MLDVTGFLKYAVQAAAMFESRFNSVERLMAYIQLPQEAPATIDATKCVHLRTACLWPACGQPINLSVLVSEAFVSRSTFDPGTAAADLHLARLHQVITLRQDGC